MIFIAGKKDVAGVSIAEELRKQKQAVAENFEIEVVGDVLRVQSSYIDAITSPGEEVIFVSKHASKKHEKKFCLHFPGNWHEAEFGGESRKLSMSSPFLLRTAFLLLKEKAKGSGYSVTLEATHHGPLCNKPCFFAEIGSSEEEWHDRRAAKMLAEVLALVAKQKGRKDKKEERMPVMLCLGGGHYCSSFNKMLSCYALTHICPQYALQFFDEEMLEEAVKKTFCNINGALVERGYGPQNRKKISGILEILRKQKISYSFVW